MDYKNWMYGVGVMNIISIDSFKNKSSEVVKNKNNSKAVIYMHSENVKMIQLSPEDTIREAMRVMEASSLETVLVIDENKRLIGLATDGDIRRAILSNIGLEEKIGSIMNRNFTAVPSSTPIKEIVKLMKKHYFKQMPIIDLDRKIVDIVLLKDIIAEKTRDNYVVLMAGGLGSRLQPLTNELPKPMLKVGDKPILEIIINQFKSYGFKNFIISINYLADIVEGYFGDGSNFDVNIQYVREPKRLGTAGCLKLIRENIEKPFFVMNGDLLTKLDFEDMLKFHIANGFDISMGIRKHEYQIPFGVINTEGNSISSIVEKPVNHCVINAGVYCVSPEIIKYVPENEYFDITSLIDMCITNNGKVGGYHIKDYWMDIGQIEDYHKANADYEYVFKDNIQNSKNFRFKAERNFAGRR